jgi:hypothetical protein
MGHLYHQVANRKDDNMKKIIALVLLIGTFCFAGPIAETFYVVPTAAMPTTNYQAANISLLGTKREISANAGLTINSAQVKFTGNINTIGNITANYFAGNGSRLTSLPISQTANYSLTANNALQLGGQTAISLDVNSALTAGAALTASTANYAVNAADAAKLGGKTEGTLSVSTANVLSNMNISQFNNNSGYVTSMDSVLSALTSTTADYAVNAGDADLLNGQTAISLDVNSALTATTANYATTANHVELSALPTAAVTSNYQSNAKISGNLAVQQIENWTKTDQIPPIYNDLILASTKGGVDIRNIGSMGGLPAIMSFTQGYGGSWTTGQKPPPMYFLLKSGVAAPTGKAGDYIVEIEDAKNSVPAAFDADGGNIIFKPGLGLGTNAVNGALIVSGNTNIFGTLNVSSIISANTYYGDGSNLSGVGGTISTNVVTDNYFYPLKIAAINIIGEALTINGVRAMYIPSQSFTQFTGTMFIGNGGVSITVGSDPDSFYNTFVGIQSGLGITNGHDNVGVGFNSLKVLTTGDHNLGIGPGSLALLTTGLNNTAIGSSALSKIVTGSNNVAIGKDSLTNTIAGGANNTAVGYQNSYANTSGANNTALGYQAMYANTTGTGNVAVGYLAGRYQADGSTGLIATTSIYIGSNSKGKDNSDTNSIVIGYNAIGLGANTVVLGNNDTTLTRLTGNVGIGTNTPRTMLDVAGTITALIVSSSRLQSSSPLIVQPTALSTTGYAVTIQGGKSGNGAVSGGAASLVGGLTSGGGATGGEANVYGGSAEGSPVAGRGGAVNIAGGAGINNLGAGIGYRGGAVNISTGVSAAGSSGDIDGAEMTFTTALPVRTARAGGFYFVNGNMNIGGTSYPENKLNVQGIASMSAIQVNGTITTNKLVDNSMAYGGLQISYNSTATVIGSSEVYVTVNLGYLSSSEVQNVTLSTANGSITILNSGVYDVSYGISAEGTNGNDLHLVFAKTAQEALAARSRIGGVSLSGAGNYVSIGKRCVCRFTAGDVIYMFIQNETGANNVTIVHGEFFVNKIAN